MVKLNGPMFSLDASGTIANPVTFSKWKGHNYARERVIPSNPKSGAQVGRRSMFKFLTQAWNAISDANQATWQDLADQLVASTFNAYLSGNMADWHNFLGPTKTTPTIRIAVPSDNVLTAAVWEENRIKLSIAGIALGDAWGLCIFGQPTSPVTPAVGNCIMTVIDDSVAAHDVFWTPPEVATWHFNSIAFAIDGKQAAAGGPQSAVP